MSTNCIQQHCAELPKIVLAWCTQDRREFSFSRQTGVVCYRRSKCRANIGASDHYGGLATPALVTERLHWQVRHKEI